MIKKKVRLIRRVLSKDKRSGRPKTASNDSIAEKKNVDRFPGERRKIHCKDLARISMVAVYKTTWIPI